jgi:cytochrome P450
MDSYFNRVIEKREKNPKSDLISNLIKATIDNNRLTNDEILAFCSLLLLAGHVTTVNLIGNTVRSLLENPNELKKLKKDPYILIPSTIEESLRYRSPVQALFRFLLEDLEFNNHKMYKGQKIVIWLGSANHDESIFKNPEKFDIMRRPNEHLAFGYGIHFCLGSTLARLEAQTVLRIIIEKFDDISFSDVYVNESLKPLHDVFLLGVSSLPIKFKERTSIN